MTSSTFNLRHQTILANPKFLSCLFLCVAGLALAACGPAAASPAVSQPLVAGTASPTPFDFASAEPAATETPEPTLEPTPDYTPTPDIRPLPVAWRTWPVVPTLSPWLVEVYESGLAGGNDPHRFTKAGDCQNIPEAFLGFYDIQGRYYFASGEEYLQETVDFYAGSWGHDGLAVDGGYNFPAIFTPLRADPQLCGPNENPLACEIRTYQPAFIIISMEFVYEGRTSQNYEEYLRQAVDYALEQNVIPILMTKADNVEGNHAINAATAQVAYDYDIPLINWWRAAQPLEGHGIDWARDAGGQPEGFHITAEAWTARSYWALVTLDAIRHGLEEQRAGS